MIPSTVAGKIVDQTPKLKIADLFHANRQAASRKGAITEKTPAMLADPEHPDWGRFFDVGDNKGKQSQINKQKSHEFVLAPTHQTKSSLQPLKIIR